MAPPCQSICLEKSEFPRPFGTQAVELLIALSCFLLRCSYVAMWKGFRRMIQRSLWVAVAGTR